MTASELIQAKPGPVQVILKAHMTKASLDLREPDWEQLGKAALRWWDGIVRTEVALLRDRPVDETRFAEELVQRLRTRPVWGKILRGNAS
jgi:hypothetical protein